MSNASIVNIVDSGKCEGGIRYAECRSVRAASQRVSGSASAGGRRAHVDVISKLQEVGTAGAGIAYSDQNLSWQFLLDIDVKLLNSALLEVGVLRQNRTCEVSRIGRRGKGGEARRHANCPRRQSMLGTGGRGKCARCRAKSK